MTMGKEKPGDKPAGRKDWRKDPELLRILEDLERRMIGLQTWHGAEPKHLFMLAEDGEGRGLSLFMRGCFCETCCDKLAERFSDALAVARQNWLRGGARPVRAVH